MGDGDGHDRAEGAGATGGTAGATQCLYVVRHGRTLLNAGGALRGHIDEPLDDVGRREAAALGEAFRDVPLSLVVSSPLSRAHDTAAEIAEASGATLLSEPSLIDRDYGPWNGALHREVCDRFGSLDEAPGVEGSEEFRTRVSSATAIVLHLARSTPVAIVAHDAVNREVVGHLTAGSAEHRSDSAQPTGSWTRLDRRPHGRWVVAVMGAVPGDGSPIVPAAMSP